MWLHQVWRRRKARQAHLHRPQGACRAGCAILRPVVVAVEEMEERDFEKRDFEKSGVKASLDRPFPYTNAQYIPQVSSYPPVCLHVQMRLCLCLCLRL